MYFIFDFLFNSSLPLKNEIGNGNIAVWGDNSNGQLGDGTTTQQTTPEILSILPDVIQIVGGSIHSLAVLGNLFK